MLKRIKKLFPKKSKFTYQAEYEITESVSFHDLAGKDLHLEIRTNGNSTIVVLFDDKKTVEFQLDQEKATLFGVLLQSYATHGVFPQLGLDNE
jgi:hypothetical protein